MEDPDDGGVGGGPVRRHKRQKRGRTVHVKVPSGWEEVRAPRKFAGMDGEMLEGTFIGSEKRSGRYGDYTVHFVREIVESTADGKTEEIDQVWYVSGWHIDQLFTAAHLLTGTQVRLLVTSTSETAEGHTVRQWSMLVRTEKKR